MHQWIFVYFFGRKSISSKFIISTLKISTAIPLLRLERTVSGLSVAYSLYGAHLLQNFHKFLAKNQFFQNLKSRFSKLVQLFPYHDRKEHSLDYHLHIACIAYYLLHVPKWLLIFYRIFIYFLAKIVFIFRIQNLDSQI